MAKCLRNAIAHFVSGGGDNNNNNCNNNSTNSGDATPEFLAQLLVAKWPRKHGRALEASNALLFTVHSAVIGWVDFVNTAAAATFETSVSFLQHFYFF